MPLILETNPSPRRTDGPAKVRAGQWSARVRLGTGEFLYLFWGGNAHEFWIGTPNMGWYLPTGASGWDGRSGLDLLGLSDRVTAADYKEAVRLLTVASELLSPLEEHATHG